MIARLSGAVLPAVTDLVTVALLRLGDAVRARLPARPDASTRGPDEDGDAATGPRTDDPGALAIEVAVTAAALALGPLVAAALVRGALRRLGGRGR